MSVKIVTGNLLDATEDIICHQVNCQGVMGAGVAKQIREKWPEVYEEYKELCENHVWKETSPLGTAQAVAISRRHSPRYVVNMFAQDNCGYYKRFTSYDAFYECLQVIRIGASNEATIAFPYGIGCGLGGGSWDVIYAMICDVLGDRDVTVYKLEEWGTK